MGPHEGTTPGPKSTLVDMDDAMVYCVGREVRLMPITRYILTPDRVRYTVPEFQGELQQSMLHW